MASPLPDPPRIASGWQTFPHPASEELPVICPMTSLYVPRANLMGELEWPRVDGTTGILEVPINGSRTG